MSSGHYCDGCAQAYYSCECSKDVKAMTESDTVVVERAFLQHLMDMMVYGDIDEKCDFGPWREIYKQTKAYLS